LSLWVRLGSDVCRMPSPPHTVTTVLELRPFLVEVAAYPQEVSCQLAVRCSMLPFGGQKDECILRMDMAGAY
jgi:hypothetical protein